MVICRNTHWIPTSQEYRPNHPPQSSSVLRWQSPAWGPWGKLNRHFINKGTVYAAFLYETVSDNFIWKTKTTQQASTNHLLFLALKTKSYLASASHIQGTVLSMMPGWSNDNQALYKWDRQMERQGNLHWRPKGWENQLLKSVPFGIKHWLTFSPFMMIIRGHYQII